MRFKACAEWLNKNLPGTFAKVTAKHLFNWHHAIRQQSDQPSQQASQQPGQPSQSYTAQQSDQLSQQASQQPGQPSQSSDQLMSPTQSFIKSRGRKRTLMEVEMEQLKQALVPIMNSGMPMTIGMIRSVLANAMGERLDYVVDFNSFKLSESTVRRWIKEWRLSMRMATTSWQDLPTNWELQRDEAVMRLAIVVKLYDIPPELVINYDQTAQHLVPTAKRYKTLVPTGTRHVAVLGLGDKRQYTLDIGCTASGDVPSVVQMIFQGKTEKCMPPVSLRSRSDFKDWVWSHTEYHWSNVDTMKALFRSINFYMMQVSSRF